MIFGSGGPAAFWNKHCSDSFELIVFEYPLWTPFYINLVALLNERLGSGWSHWALRY